MKRLLLVGYYGHGNFGDDLILETLLRVLGGQFVLSAIDFDHARCGQVTELEAEGRFRSIPIYTERRPVLSKFNALLLAVQMIVHGARHDILAFGGGTQLFETRKNGVLPLASKAFYILALRFFLGVRIVHLFVGMNAPRTRIGKLLLTLIVRNSDFLVLRDAHSLKQCQSLGARPERLYLAADIAYLRDPPVRSKASRQDSPLLGISIFPYFSRVEGDPAGDASYLQRVRDAIAAVEAQTGSRPRLRFIGSQVSGTLDDVAYAHSISSLFWDYDVDYIAYECDTDAHLQRIAQLDIVIAMRLHVLISSALAGVRQIAVLPYQTKVLEEARALGIAQLVDTTLPDWNVDACFDDLLAERSALNRSAIKALCDRIYLAKVPERQTEL